MSSTLEVVFGHWIDVLNVKWVQPNLLTTHLFIFYLSPLGLQPAEVFKKKTCGAGAAFSFEGEQRRRRAGAAIFRFWSSEACWAFFLEQKTGVCSVRFSRADFAAAVLLLSRNFIQPIFPKRLICAVAVKGNF